MRYVDGFVIPLPKKNLAKYKKMATVFSKVCREHGALEYVECIADDVSKGKTTSFPRSVKLKAGEIVVFSWVIYKSRTHRDFATKKIMKDPRLAKFMNPKNMPSDGKRMFWGGFKTIIDFNWK